MKASPFILRATAALSLLATTASAQQIDIQIGPSSKALVFQNVINYGTHLGGGDLYLTDGRCYGNVETLPTGGVVSVFGDKGVIKDGRLYMKGPILFDSVFEGSGIKITKNNVTTATITSNGTLHLFGRCRNAAGCSNTFFEPNKWNDGNITGGVQVDNNCYNYALDKITNTSAQPGSVCGQRLPNDSPFDFFTKEEILSRVLCDGLTWVGEAFPGNSYDCGAGHLVFLALAQRYGSAPKFADYHFWRLDNASATWSHKRGQGPAQWWDGSSQAISNPLASDRWDYTTPVGFFCACSQLNIQ